MSKRKYVRLDLPCFSRVGKPKRRFENMDEAALWISEGGEGGKYRVYECPDCGGAHLTRKNKR